MADAATPQSLRRAHQLRDGEGSMGLCPLAFCWGFWAVADVGQARACRALANQHHLIAAGATACAAAIIAVLLLASLLRAPFPTAVQLGRLSFPPPKD